MLGRMEHFILRLWVGPTADATTALHGTIQHVRSGAERAFASPDELVAFLRQAAQPAENELTAVTTTLGQLPTP
jgi:hypothetical protein